MTLCHVHVQPLESESEGTDWFCSINYLVQIEVEHSSYQRDAQIIPEVVPWAVMGTPSVFPEF